MNRSFAGLPRPGASLHMLHAGLGDVADDENGTLMFDRSGRICGGGAAADSLFGAGRGRITGRMISEFIPDMLVGKSSAGRLARSAAARWARGDWQYFDALDVLGRSFEIAIHLSRRMTNGEEVFVLHFHRPGQARFSPRALP